MIAVGANSLSEYLGDHRLRELFIENLGWDHASDEFELTLEGETFAFTAVAAKRGFMSLASCVHRTVLANRGLLRQLQKLLSRRYHEHIVVFYCEEPAKQVWQWATLREDGKRHRHREHPFFSNQPPTELLSRLELMRFSLGEEESATLMDVVSRVRKALDVSAEQDLFARRPNFARQSDTLAVRMRNGDCDAFDEFVLFHQKLAKKASRMLVRWVGLESDDAEQIAMMGVIEAAKRFDPARGFQFSTYASYWIRQQCQRYAAYHGLMIKFPPYRFWPAYKFEFEHRQLIATYGSELDDDQVDASLEEIGLQRDHWDTFVATRSALRFSDLDRDQFDAIRSIRSSDEPLLDRVLKDEMVQATLAEMTDRLPRRCLSFV